MVDLEVRIKLNLVIEMEADKLYIPIWKKLNLTIEETAKYSNIGENTLRNIIKENPTLDFIEYVGKKVLIKREAFEVWNSKQYIIK